MRGNHGLVLVVFGILVWLATSVGAFRDVDPRILQLVGLLALFGLALVLVGFARKILEVLVNYLR